jgi:hypothetical protein
VKEDVDVSRVDFPLNEELDLLPDKCPAAGDEEDKSHGVGEEARGEEQDASYQHQGPVDQLPRWHLSLGEIHPNIGEDGETLLAHHVTAEYPGKDDDGDGIKGSYPAPDLDEKQDLHEGNDDEDEDEAHRVLVLLREKGFRKTASTSRGKRSPR